MGKSMQMRISGSADQPLSPLFERFASLAQAVRGLHYTLIRWLSTFFYYIGVNLLHEGERANPLALYRREPPPLRLLLALPNTLIAKSW